jgi:hypothetical protein
MLRCVSYRARVRQALASFEIRDSLFSAAATTRTPSICNRPTVDNSGPIAGSALRHRQAADPANGELPRPNKIRWRFVADEALARSEYMFRR